jgi:phage/plasmid-associated DNA primase
MIRVAFSAEIQCRPRGFLARLRECRFAGHAAQFVEAKCEKGETYRVSRGDLYQDYAKWAKATRERAMSERVFVSAMVERGYKEYRTSRERG